LATANSKARIIFGITPNDYGKPFQDLEISYRPIELRSLIDQIAKKNSPIVVTRIPRHTSGKTQFFDVYVQPMIESDGDRIGVCVQFDDVTEFYEMQDQLSSVNQQLQDANEELQSAHEELETINEELQSTNEELETTNEELQSTNEELETMNEELQSTNSELEIANEDQQKLASKVEQTNSFLEAILSSMRSCVIVLNEKYQILVWNDYCRELWGMRVEEVKGQSLFELDIGLPLQQLKTPLRTFINLKKTYDEIKLKAVNRRGRNIDCTVRVTPLNNPKEPGVILLIEDE
jgi:two-component system CheB/CheR fusion protein